MYIFWQYRFSSRHILERYLYPVAQTLQGGQVNQEPGIAVLPHSTSRPTHAWRSSTNVPPRLDTSPDTRSHYPLDSRSQPPTGLGVRKPFPRSRFPPQRCSCRFSGQALHRKIGGTGLDISLAQFYFILVDSRS